MNIALQPRRGTTVVPIIVPRSKLLGHFRGSREQSLPNVSEAVTAALESPLDSPPLSRVLAPGDHLVLVVDAGLPRPVEFLVPILHAITNAQVAPADITVLHAGNEGFDTALREELPAYLSEMTMLRHDPEDARAHAYLASTRAGQRVYLNRILVDADAVIVVGEIAFDFRQGYAGTASHLFPIMSNHATQARARRQAFANRLNPELLRQRLGADEVAWLMGLFFSVGIALDRDRAVEGVWAGHYPSVQKAGVDHAQRHWIVTPGIEAAELVIVTTSARPENAGWDELGAALEVARQLVADAGAILALSDMDAPFGETGRWLAEEDNPDLVLQRLQHPEAAAALDSLATAQCAAALATARVHLFSSLPPETVEAMAMVAINSPRGVENILQNARSVWVVEDADRVHIRGGARHPALYARAD